MHKLLLGVLAAFLSVPALAYVEVPGVGAEAQGADVVVTNLDGDARPDMILMAYDNPWGANSFRYRVGRNLDANGIAQGGWRNYIEVPGVGWEAQGAGAAITQLDRNSRPDLILMAYDNPPFGNAFRYRVGLNLDDNGVAKSWGQVITVDGVGWEGQGADILVTNLDGDVRPEIVLLAFDNPSDRPSSANTIRYKVGFNVNSAGVATHWSNTFSVTAPFESQGLGAAIVNYDSDPRPELLIMVYESIPFQNRFTTALGMNIGSTGEVSQWWPFVSTTGTGWEGQGAGIAVTNLQGDAWDELIYMAYDNPSGENTFRYEVSTSSYRNAHVFLEMDASVAAYWPLQPILRNGAYHSLASIYAKAGIQIDTFYDQSGLPEPATGVFDDASLDAFMAANMNRPPGDARTHVYMAILGRHKDTGTAGIMFDNEQRRGVAIFQRQIVSDNPNPADTFAITLRTMAHELGHIFCLSHLDGDAASNTYFSDHQNPARSLMNLPATLPSDWDFVWGANELHHFYDHSKAIWQPRSGYPFLNGSVDPLANQGCH